MNLLKNRSFRNLLFGQISSNIGDIFYIISIINIMYQYSKSAFILSLIPFVTTLFRFLCGLIAPIFIDKYSLKNILVSSQLFKSLLLICLCILILYEPNYFVVLLFVSLISFIDGIQNPASNSLIPSLIHKEELVKANGLFGISDQTIQIISWPLGSVLLSFLVSSNILLLITVFLYVCALLFNASISIQNVHEREERTSKLESLKSGWSKLLNTPSIRNLTIIDILNGMANGVWVAAIIYVFVDKHLHVGQEWWGYINTSMLLGMIIGGYVSVQFSKWIEVNISKCIIISTILCTLLTLSFGVNHIPFIALVLVLFHGIPIQVREVAEITVFQQSADDKLLAKIYSAHSVIFNLTFGCSVLILGWITEVINVQFTFVFASLLQIIALVIALINKKNISTISNKEEANLNA
ncbi:MFS transporter [uncultured Paenibacillus sp.]|uniref:MFS transporter n=1 Tax=uncultured Paenibacillus sp. TaxID=227322 RepID=UPI0015B2CB83|nr:MFS transporter [uncultured Paenibacillus sp.]